MGKDEIMALIKLTPTLIGLKNMWSSYDEEADVLYIDFDKPSIADDSELTEDNILIRYQNEKVVGVTVLNAKKRKPQAI